MSLLEVLAAIGVLSIGLLGLAALLPIGRYTIAEATKADHAGNCGRAALRDVVIRRMLDSSNWSNNQLPGKGAFLIDPLGVTNGLTGKFASSLPRLSLNNITNIDQAKQVFMATDDLIVQLPEEMNPPQPVGRPTTNPTHKGDYSWFLTVVPTPNNPTRFTVSVVVCCKRDFPPIAATACEVSAPILASGFYDLGFGGGSVARPNQFTGLITVKENDWLALCGTNAAKPIQTICRWYRVVAVGDDGLSMTLVGPDWDTSYTTTAVAVGQSVLGVYTTTVDVDTNPTWKN